MEINRAGVVGDGIEDEEYMLVVPKSWPRLVPVRRVEDSDI